MNMNGMSHARATEFCGNALKHEISRSSAYRSKIKQAKHISAEHDYIKQLVLKSPHLNVDEFHWPLGRKRGYGIVALAKDACLVKVTDSHNIKTLCKMLPDYHGMITQDSYPG